MMMSRGDIMLKSGDKVSLVACSNGLSLKQKAQIENLCILLKQLGLIPLVSPYLYRQQSYLAANAKMRAKVLLDAYRDTSIKAIFDVSGGDVANGILEWLDFELIKANPKPFFGYSDLTTIINALYQKTGQLQYLYQIRNLRSNIQYQNFNDSILNGQKRLYNFNYRFIQQDYLAGTMIGGNIRCLLKLAGTPYFPDVDSKILFLESFSGNGAVMMAYLTQLKQMGVFDKINGLLLGTFTAMETSNEVPDIVSIAVSVINNIKLPIVKTEDIGHNLNAKCLIIGKKYEFKKSGN